MQSAENWFVNTAAGRYVAEREQRFLAQYAGRADEICVQLGGAWLRPSEHALRVPEQLQTDCFQTAFAPCSVNRLILPHSHEYSGVPFAVLAEAVRVLSHGGRLVLTGFNPHSLWGKSAWFDGTRLPTASNLITLPRLKQEAARLGLEVEYGQFMVYVPPLQSEAALRRWAFLEKAGDRWWPQWAAVYGLVLVKRMAGVRPLDEAAGFLAQEPAVAVGLAKTARAELDLKETECPNYPK